MDVTFFLAVALILGVGSIGIAISRAGLIVLALLPASQMLGFLDPMLFAVKGFFDIHALFVLLMVVSLMFSLKHFRDLQYAKLKKPILVFLALYIYGVIYPVINDHSSLFYSVKASKEFLTIFFYFAIFFFIRSERDVRLGWIILFMFGIYYSCLEMAVQVFGANLASHMTYDYRREGTLFWKIYPPFWPVILITFLYFYFYQALGGARKYILLGVSGFGLLLTFFRSYLLGAFAVVPIMLMLVGRGVWRTASKTFALISVIAFTIIIIDISTGGGLDAAEKLVDQFVFSGVTEITSQEGGALAGREAYAKGRRDILDSAPNFGFGFIDKDSAFGFEVRKQVIGDLLGFVDKGNLDVALKFGYVGSFILYGAASYLVFILIKLARTDLPRNLKAKLLTAAGMVMIFLIVQPVHAPLTYSFSLLPLGIVLGLIERELFLFYKNKEMPQ